MEVKINEINASEREVEVTLTYDEITDDIKKEIKEQTKKISVPGFRKGKVPLDMLKKMYGDALEYEASEKVANNKFWDVAKENHLHPIGQPVLNDIKFEPGKDMYFRVKYEVIPKLEVKDYTGQTIDVPDFKVTDEEINKEIDYILRTNAVEEESDIVDGNEVKLEAEILRIDKDENPYPGSASEKMTLDLTNQNMQPEIRQNAQGKKVGESFTFTFTDERTLKDKDGKDDLIREEFTYKVNILGIKKIVLPELNEELISKASKGKAKTEEELKEVISKEIEHYYEHKEDEIIRGRLISLIVKNNEFTAPSSMIDNILNEMIKSETEKLKRDKITTIKKEDLQNYLRPQAELEVKWYLLRKEIISNEKIEITDDELNELAQKDAEKTGLAVEKLIQYYKSSNYHENIINQKLFKFLKENSNINKIAPEKFYNPENKDEQ